MTLLAPGTETQGVLGLLAAHGEERWPKRGSRAGMGHRAGLLHLGLSPLCFPEILMDLSPSFFELFLPLLLSLPKLLAEHPGLLGIDKGVY